MDDSKDINTHEHASTRKGSNGQHRNSAPPARRFQSIFEDSDDESNVSNTGSMSSTSGLNGSTAQMHISKSNDRLSALKLPKKIILDTPSRDPEVIVLSDSSTLSPPPPKRRRLQQRTSPSPKATLEDGNLNLLVGMFGQHSREFLASVLKKFKADLPEATDYICKQEAGAAPLEDEEEEVDMAELEMEERIKATLVRHGKTQFKKERHDTYDEELEEEEYGDDKARILAIVDSIVDGCDKVSKQMESILAKASFITQPEKMRTDVQLKGYQLKGLEWLIALHDLKKSAILADEMVRCFKKP